MATRRINVGSVPVGGGAPVSIQSMTNTRTEDVHATVEQIKRLEKAGCDIVRVAVPTMEAAGAIRAVKDAVSVPVVADIHFDYRLAVAAAEAGADKIRINPGNIGGEKNVRAVADACRAAGVPIRIGINGGSLEKPLLAKYGGVTPEAMVESARAQAAMLERFGFENICISLKASDVRTTVAANRLAAATADYPLHIGLTEAGAGDSALMKASAAVGALLIDGIGDTLRVSLTDDPVKEVETARKLLRVLGLRGGVNIVACPTCGRTQIDLFSLYREVEAGLAGLDRDVTVAVMGCAVNGPGEAAEADYGVAGGREWGILFKKGREIARLPESELARALIALVSEDTYGEKVL